ncbi:hypothetical protein AOQ84DRAFT_373497 [Glonium stellatum]|uniref:Uncharacterized protein n=1 Tax=Glonium stellatum TaxID=574774 RepID=A0A8E2F8M9_9PEZI|nr:hypothetical protein AOQ84DRAFT_373497 [Glonium stellatum]
MSTMQKVLKPNASAPPPADTLPSSPTLPLARQAITMEHAQQFLELLQLAVTTKVLPEAAQGAPPVVPSVEEDLKSEEVKRRALRLEYKTVTKVWDNKAYKYKIAELVTLIEEFSKERKTEKATNYMDINSEGLRDILRAVLEDVRGISLREDRLSIEQSILYYFLSELQLYQINKENGSANDMSMKHLSILVDYLEYIYKSTIERLGSFLSNKKIIYNLL